MPETKAHNVRIPEWDEAAEIAAEIGETVTAMIRRGLRREMDIARTENARWERMKRQGDWESNDTQP